jgi:hypothetical protein
MDHDIVANVSHTFFILDSEVDVSTPSGMIRVVRRLT